MRTPENSANINHEQQDKQKKKFGIVLFILSTFIVAVLLFALLPQREKEVVPSEIAVQEGLGFGIIPGDELDPELEAWLNQNLSDAMFHMSMNVTPRFATPTSDGNVRIRNVEQNLYPMTVEIIDTNTGDVVLTTGRIDPGYYLETVRLDKPLEKGSHDCRAIFTAYHPESTDVVGKSGLEIVLTVES